MANARRATLWFAAGAGAVLAAEVGGYCALVRYAFAAWERPRKESRWTRVP